MKTHRSTQLFAYCSAGEHTVKCVRPALTMEAGKEEQRGVNVSWWLRVLWRVIKSKRSEMLSDGIILLHDNARPHTANLVKDKLQRFGWETLQHPPYSPDFFLCDFHIFGDLKKDTSFIRTRKFKSGCGCGSISDLPLSTRLELIVSSPSGINVLTLLVITCE